MELDRDEEKSRGFMAIRDVEVTQIPKYTAFRTVPSVLTSVADGELVVVIKSVATRPICGSALQGLQQERQ